MGGMASWLREHLVVTALPRPISRGMTGAICVLAIGSAELHGQPIPNGADAAQIIASAESEGAAFRRLPKPAVVTTMFASPPEQVVFEEFFGRAVIPVKNQHTENRTCAVGYGMGPVRSGEFIIGGQLSGRVAMVAGQRGKVWWAPLHHARIMPPLLVRGRNLSAPNDTVRFITRMVAQTVGQAPLQYFFPSGILVPRPGRWLMVATSGANWGCFILAVR